MISLLLTLFISLFSICPAFNKVDQLENNVCLFDSVSHKEAINVDSSRYAYAMDEVFNIYNIHNYVAWYPSFFENGYTGNVVRYGTFDSVGTIDRWANINFEDLTSSNNAFTFRTIELTIIGVGYTSQQNYAGYYRRIELRFLDADNTAFGRVYTFDYFNGTTRGGVDNDGYILNQSVSGDMTDFVVIIHRPLSDFFINLFSYYTSESYDEGFRDGTNYGYQNGYTDGNRVGYQDGYTAGYNEASSYDNTASTIFEGIFDVGLLPVNVFLTIFNFEVFGVNLAGIVSGLLTLAVVVIILRFLLGGKKDDK